jgi:hypothetical protein
MPAETIQALAHSLIEYATNNKKNFRLPPALKTYDNILEVLEFFFKYYSNDKDITLKNANRYISFSKVSISKIHIWLQSISHGIRIYLLSSSPGNDEEIISTVYHFFNKNIPECPLILRSATDKYKFITISKWNDSEFIHCCQKEIECLRNNKELPVYLPKSLKKDMSHDATMSALQELLNASEVLDTEGNYILSEKILINTENLASKLRQQNEHNKL